MRSKGPTYGVWYSYIFPPFNLCFRIKKLTCKHTLGKPAHRRLVKLFNVNWHGFLFVGVALLKLFRKIPIYNIHIMVMQKNTFFYIRTYLHTYVCAYKLTKCRNETFCAHIRRKFLFLSKRHACDCE